MIREDIYRVIDEVKQSYGGHFHGKLFSGIMKDIQTVVLRDFSRSLRPTVRLGFWGIQRRLSSKTTSDDVLISSAFSRQTRTVFMHCPR